MENSDIFVPSSFSHLKSDVVFFDLHVFQTMLYISLISARAHFTKQTMQASHMSILLKHLLVL